MTSRTGARAAAPAARRSVAREAPPAASRGRALSIRWIATALTVLLTATAVLSVAFVAERNARQALWRETETRTLLLARNLALTSTGALLSDFPELTLQPVVKEILARQSELAFATVVNHRGVIQGDADPRRLGTAFAGPPDLAPVTDAGALADGERLGADERLLVARVPVRQGGGEVIGTAYVGLRRDYIERTLAASRRQQGLVVLGLVLFGMAAAFLLMSQLLRPVGALRQGLERIGRGDLDTPIRLRDRTELGLLADAVDEMAGALKHAQVEMVERERLAYEIDLARQIQQSLLPSESYELGPFRIRGDHREAAEVGGDYFDVLRLSDGRVGIAIADVAGKGLGGCLVMSMLSALLRALRDVCTSPADMLVTLDQRLSESLRPGEFVTMFYGVLDPGSGRLTWASAGHNPLLVWRRASGRVETLPSRGIPLAAIRGGAIWRTLEDAELVLAPGDVAVQYTDGYTEAFAADGRAQFGLERIREIVTRTAAKGGDAVLRELAGALTAWKGGIPPSDDETLLVVSAEGARWSVTDDGRGEEGRSAAQVALALLERAEADGERLEIPARLDLLLPALRSWLEGLGLMRGLDSTDAELLASALYEVCANVVEHGYGGDVRRTFDLWWLDPRGIGMEIPGDEGDVRTGQRRYGCFVLRDDAAPFRPEQWHESDFADPGTRRRGRGIGLDIIHRVMREVSYQPDTPRGNLTLLVFGPRLRATSKEGAST